MMDSLYMKLFTNTLLTSLAEKIIIIVPNIQVYVYHSQENQQASKGNTWLRNTISAIWFIALRD